MALIPLRHELELLRSPSRQSGCIGVRGETFTGAGV
jgi:hypothetical protein